MLVIGTIFYCDMAHHCDAGASSSHTMVNDFVTWESSTTSK